jgi:hypothetical protein
MFPPRLLEDLFSIHDDVARRIHPESHSTAPDIQDGYSDVVSDHQDLSRPAGQNKHGPLPPDDIYIRQRGTVTPE